MRTQTGVNKRVVVVFWKNRAEDPFEVFSSLKNFCQTYKDYNYNTLSNYLSKEKIAYDNKDVRIERKTVISKPIESNGTVRSIAPVVRKVLLKDANDKERDLDYWLSRPPIERVAAITFIISQSLKEGERMDKTHIVKRKMKL